MQKDYTNYNPRQASMEEARALLTRGSPGCHGGGAAAPGGAARIYCGSAGRPQERRSGQPTWPWQEPGPFTKRPGPIAEAIAGKVNLEGSSFEKLEIAGPGFHEPVSLLPLFMAMW